MDVTHLSSLSTGGSSLWPHHKHRPPALGGRKSLAGVSENLRAGFGHWAGGLDPGGCQGNSSSPLLATQDDTSAFPCTKAVGKSRAGARQRSKSTCAARSPCQPLRQPTLISSSLFHILPLRQRRGRAGAEQRDTRAPRRARWPAESPSPRHPRLFDAPAARAAPTRGQISFPSHSSLPLPAVMLVRVSRRSSLSTRSQNRSESSSSEPGGSFQPGSANLLCPSPSCTGVWAPGGCGVKVQDSS